MFQLGKHLKESSCKDTRYKDDTSSITYFCAFCTNEGAVFDTVDAFNKHLQVRIPEIYFGPYNATARWIFLALSP